VFITIKPIHSTYNLFTRYMVPLLCIHSKIYFSVYLNTNLSRILLIIQILLTHFIIEKRVRLYCRSFNFYKY